MTTAPPEPRGSIKCGRAWKTLVVATCVLVLVFFASHALLQRMDPSPSGLLFRELNTEKFEREGLNIYIERNPTNLIRQALEASCRFGAAGMPIDDKRLSTLNLSPDIPHLDDEPHSFLYNSHGRQWLFLLWPTNGMFRVSHNLFGKSPSRLDQFVDETKWRATQLLQKTSSTSSTPSIPPAP